MADHSADAVLLVDVQNDFCPGGALAVPDGDRVVPVLNRVAAAMAARGARVYASRDWHPRDTTHFQDRGGPWPVHCVADTSGAAFHPGLALPPSAEIVTKGDVPRDHGYSAFEGHLADGTSFGEDLRRHGIGRLIVGGLATDYCVKHSVLDARRAGLEVAVLGDAIAGVDVMPGDSTRAIEEMREAGARFVESREVT